MTWKHIVFRLPVDPFNKILHKIHSVGYILLNNNKSAKRIEHKTEVRNIETAIANHILYVISKN